MSDLVGPGPGCMFCGGIYEQHTWHCPQTEKARRPRRFRLLLPDGKHPTGCAARYLYGVYFPTTDLCVGEMAGRGTGEPQDVEWLDSL